MSTVLAVVRVVIVNSVCADWHSVGMNNNGDASSPRIQLGCRDAPPCDCPHKEGDVRPRWRTGWDISNSDRLAAKKFGIRFIDPAVRFGWLKNGAQRFEKKEEVDEYFRRNPHLILPSPGKCPFPSLVPKKT